MAWFVPALMVASTAMTIMGHRQNIKNMKANAAWKRYENELQLQHDKQKLFKKQAKLLSEKRARTAASGIRFSGSPLITAKADYDEFENDLMFLEKGVFVKNASMNAELTGMIASETYKMGATLLQSGVNYKTYEMNRKLAEKGLG
tara:strand:+ start:97 stop:534 length:438 start_codon:yes stop_codon:yes gene_type:complete